MPFDPCHLHSYPQQPGVYLMHNAQKQVIYVGKAKRLRTRLQQYFSKSGDSRAMIPYLLQQTETIACIIVSNEKEALLLENRLIKQHQPRYNALLKDDKTYLSLRIQRQQRWPRVELVRGQPPRKRHTLYFGPYTSALAAKETLDVLNRAFPLRECSDSEFSRRQRPCLLYGIKRCLAPCVNKCSQEEYQLHLQGAIQFLKGERQGVLKRLKEQMAAASEQLQFERAAALLRTIRCLEATASEQRLYSRLQVEDCDVIGWAALPNAAAITRLCFRRQTLTDSQHYPFAEVVEEDGDLLTSFLLQHYLPQQKLPQRILLPFALAEQTAIEQILQQQGPVKLKLPSKGERELLRLANENARFFLLQQSSDSEQQILSELAEKCALSRYPRRIECFDLSNLSGSDPVAAVVAFSEGKKDGARTRFYKLRAAGGDDYAGMSEVLQRRLRRGKAEGDLPDLLCIDGGKGHLQVAMRALQAEGIAGVDVLALAKEKGRHDKGICLEKIFLPQRREALLLPGHSALLLFLQQMRDSVHQTVLRFHRQQRKKRIISSGLRQVPGIGPSKEKRLLHHFGSIEKMRWASDGEILAVAGVTRRDLAALQQFLAARSS